MYECVKTLPNTDNISDWEKPHRQQLHPNTCTNMA